MFGTVAEAMAETGADTSIIFVPPAFAKDAMIEAIDAGIGLLVVITEGIPVQDTAEAWAHAKATGTTRVIGPNCPGIITPGESLVGITPNNITGKGPIGLVSKSGTLTYQMMYELRDLGFSTAIGIGGDPIVGTTHIDALARIPGRPRDEGDRHDRRDRRRRRRACGRLHQGERDEAGRRLRRRASPRPRARPWATRARSSPARPGPLRRRRRPSRPPASRSARRRARPPT